MVFEWILLAGTVSYAFFLGISIYFLDQLSAENKKSSQPGSLLIPVRNESEHLPGLFSNLQKIDFPMGSEIILIDDHSTDFTRAEAEELCQNMKISCKVIPSQGQGKKHAIETGIKAATNEYILNTDADCQHSPHWAKCMSSSGAQTFTIGLVWIENHPSFLAQLQALEQMALNVLGILFYRIKEPLYCSGANLGYDKTLFSETNPYHSNRHISSGDDYFFLKAIKESHPHTIRLTADSNTFVYTKPLHAVSKLFSQKSRWIKKTMHQQSLYQTAIGLLAIFYIFFPFLCLGLVVIEWVSIYYGVMVVLLKFGIDYLFLFLIARKTRQSFYFVKSLLVQFAYPFYVLGVMGHAFFGSLTWKGRQIKY